MSKTPIHDAIVPESPSDIIGCYRGLLGSAVDRLLKYDADFAGLLVERAAHVEAQYGEIRATQRALRREQVR